MVDRHTYFLAELGRALGVDAAELGPSLARLWSEHRRADHGVVTRYEGAATWIVGERRIVRICVARSSALVDLEVIDVDAQAINALAERAPPLPRTP
jgi:hypothetical protein